MARLLITPNRLKLAPGEPLPKSVRLTFIGTSVTPHSTYRISLRSKTLWEVNSDEDGTFAASVDFAPDRAGDFQFEISKLIDARQGIDAEANRAFVIQYEEPKPSRWAALKAKAARQFALLRRRGDA